MAYMEIEDYFAQAVDRLLAGESIDDILVSYPPSARNELRNLLVVVEAAERMATAAVPAPASLNRISARLHFAQRAAELRDELGAVSKAVPGTPLRPASTAAGAAPSVWQRLCAGWDALRPPTPLLRLAPLTAVLLVAFLLTFTVVGSAQEALPGDQIYGLKKWMREQRVATAPPALQAEERHNADQAQAYDVEKAAEEMLNEPNSDPIRDSAELQFLGTRNGLYQIGSLLVVPSYRSDLSDAATWMPMTIVGDLTPGIEVELHYQIVPGMPDIVEGISLKVVPSNLLPTPEPTPTSTHLSSNGCQRTEPPNWTRYTVRPGETLRSIAARGTVSSDQLRAVNCLTDGPIDAGTTIFVPETIALPQPGTAPAGSSPQMTPLPTATQLPPTAAPTVMPGTVTPAEPESATSTATATETSVETPDPSGTVGATETPASATPAPSSTPEAGTATLEASPTSEEGSAVPPTAIPSTDTATPAGNVTPDASATPAEAVSATPTTAAPTAAASPQATAAATVSALPSAIPADTATTVPVAATNTQIATSTATEVAGSSAAATSAPPTAVPPTAVPPTAVPSTAVPPTAVPPTAVPPTPTEAGTSDGGAAP